MNSGINRTKDTMVQSGQRKEDLRMTKVSLARALKRWTIKGLVLGPCPNISDSYFSMQLIFYEINRVVGMYFWGIYRVFTRAIHTEIVIKISLYVRLDLWSYLLGESAFFAYSHNFNKLYKCAISCDTTGTNVIRIRHPRKKTFNFFL